MFFISELGKIYFFAIRATFPALASRQIRHSDQRQMLHHLPYPIKESWTHDFCCLPFIDQKKTPSSTQMEQLIEAGLGKTKIVFPDKTAKHHEFCHILENNVPQLKEAGGYNLYRPKAGGQNRDIFKLNCTWYNIPDIRKEVTGSVCIYIKPLEKDLNLQRKPVVSTFVFLCFHSFVETETSFLYSFLYIIY